MTRLSARFDLLPRPLQRLVVGIARHEDRVRRHHSDAAERQVDGGAIPVVERDAVLRGDGDGVDRPSGMLRQLDDAEAGDARHLGHVGGERDVVAFLERRKHFGEGNRTTLAVEFAVVGAGAADGADAEPLGGARIEFTVAVPRNQHLGAVPFIVALDERRHQMLAMPHGDDRRHLHRVVDRRRLDHLACAHPHQTEIRSGDGAGGALESR